MKINTHKNEKSEKLEKCGLKLKQKRRTKKNAQNLNEMPKQKKTERNSFKEISKKI